LLPFAHHENWHDAWSLLRHGPKQAADRRQDMNPIATGVAGALISGVLMYTVGANAAPSNALSSNPALVQTADGHFVPVSSTTTVSPALRQAAGSSIQAVTPTPLSTARRAPAARRTVNRPARVTNQEIVRDEDYRPERSWGKTAMIVGGSAAGGAGVGGILGGKKGALIGAAIGGGAASIYEATRRD
jgi:hypothetical protein